jgi:hypothetical protein
MPNGCSSGEVAEPPAGVTKHGAPLEDAASVFTDRARGVFERLGVRGGKP